MVALASLLVLAVGVGLAGAFVGHRMEQRVVTAVECRLPAGAEVTDVDVDARPLVTLVTQEVGEVRLTVTLDEGALAAAAAEQGAARDGPAPELALAGGTLTASLPDVGVPAEVVLAPSLHDGDVRLTPVSVRVGNRSFDPSLISGALGARAGSGAADPLAPRDLTVPDLPDGVELVAISVDGDRLAIACPARLSRAWRSCSPARGRRPGDHAADPALTRG